METVLFTARKAGNRPVQKWVTPKEAARIRPIYERDGWMVETKDIAQEAEADKK